MTDFAIGVVSQGAQVCSIIATYIGSLKDRDEDLASISRQAQDLESVFQTLKESLTQGSKDPSTVSAAAHVLNSVQRCEIELNSLKQFVTRFSDSLSPNARPQDKIIQQAKKLKYPFKKSDISRIQRSLGAMKETLDLALQSLELRYVQLAISKLATLEKASQQVSNGLHTEKDGLLERFPQDIATVTNAIDESDLSTSICKLASKPSNLAALCDSLQHHNRKTTPAFNALQKAPAVEASSCPCRRHLSHQTKRASLLSWNFWDNETIYFEHYEGCKYFRSNGDERSRVRGLRLTGFVKTAIIVTFYTKTGAGGHSLGANLEYYATVDRTTSPAFCVLSVLKKCIQRLPWEDMRQSDHEAQWERLVLAAVQKLESIFRLGKARAKDIDSFNRSLLHAAAQLVNRGNGKVALVEGYSLPVARLAKFLIEKQVSASLRDLDGEQAFTTALGYEPSSIALAEAFYPDNADIYALDRVKIQRGLNSEKIARPFKFFAAIPRAAEVFYGPLSVAILSNNQYETYRLLQKHPKCLEEREYRFGMTPLHLAVGNPQCLRILVERCNSRHLVQSDYSQHTVLQNAIILSKSLCDQREGQDESSCQCTLPLRILLEGGCPIIPYLDFRPSSIYDETWVVSASLHCRIHLAKTLLQRRQELKSIALQHLSPLEIDKFRLHRPVVLDIYAMQVDELLRHRGFIEFGPLATYLEEEHTHNEFINHYRSHYNKYPIYDYRSIYHDLSDAEDAKIYFSLGFLDLTARIHNPRKWRPISSRSFNLQFVKWLLDHDAPIFEWVTQWLPWTGFVADAFLLPMLRILPNLWSKVPGNAYVGDGDQEMVREIEERVLLDDSVDDCHCRCSPGGCTPFVVRMKYMALSKGDQIDIAYIATTIAAYFKEYGNTLQRGHCHAAIRFLTFKALDIVHTCDCRRSRGTEHTYKLDTEEIAEIQDEYAESLEVLESLIEGFEARVAEIFDAATHGLDSMPSFWSDYWAPKISQVLSKLSEADDASKFAAEDMGIIWNLEPMGEMDEEPEPSWEGWDYYFQEIENIE